MVLSTRHIPGVASVEKIRIIPGFNVTGIYPLNSHTFSAEDSLVPAMLQERDKTVYVSEK
jgi:hypothetical protein